ncbi:myosin-2 heavy chain-like [Pogonomyrmex barbatus]|uniref:Myosin-2 heavy chain-like n=1 Tax=Pogonomyrmex barbatus TaxID=144034 RepID=A0A6I9WNE8_9HYME|nr:myosin-2 heavy chain-like [Pogonomyrmex barbatus]
MSDKYLDDYLPVIAIDVAVEEKTRIAKMAVATLRKLHNVMRQMRDWREDSAKLKSNIWRMKMALRADDKNGNDSQQIDPLIVHQRAEISRLEQANGALENEVTSLKCALTKAEEDIARITVREMGDKIVTIGNEFSGEKEHASDEILRPKEDETGVTLRQFQDRLDEFARGDRTIEVIFANAIGKTVETVIGLSEELVNVTENLYRFKNRNKNLRLKLDRLRAMLRSKCGNSAEYRRRIGELNNLAEQLMGEMGRLKVIRENANYSESSSAMDIPDVVRHVERLMNDLRNNLKSDREAMIAAGEPDCLKYMKKVVNLKVNLRMLSVELRRSNVPMDKGSCENFPGGRKCMETASLLDDLLKEIDSEIGKLKIKPMDKYCRIGGVNGTRYMTKVVELEDIVRKSIAVIAILKQASPEIINTNEKITEALEDLIERLCCKIKELEIFDDRANLRERIAQMEALIIYLKSELSEKNESIDALSDERANIRLTLESDRKKYEKIIVDVREANESLRGSVKKSKQEILELSLKRDHFEQRVAEMQLMKVEIDAVRKELRELRDDKGMLLGEVEKMRGVLRERDKEIENIITQGDALKGVLRAEVEDLKTKLGITSDENVKLRSIIEGLEKQKEHERLDKLKSSEKGNGEEDPDNGEYCARNLRDELEYSKAESNEPEIRLSKAMRIGYLKCALDKVAGDGAMPEDEISDLKSNEQSLTYRSNVRTSSGKETLREYERVMAGYKASENKVKQLQNEKEQLEKELSELRSEKGLLDRSMADANNKCAVLQDQVNKFKSERNGLRGKISEHEAAAENLKFELERTRGELEDAAVNAARLRSENSRIVADLDTLSLRNIETEDRVRVLLTEKNELATRINELNDENVALREQLNKATCDTRERDNVELRRQRDDARGRINEIGNECRVFGNQLKIQRMKYEALRLAVAALRDESNDRKNYLRKIDTHTHPLHERGFADAYNEINEQKLGIACTGIKAMKIDERRNGETEVKVESDTCADRDNKAEIKDKPKAELKRLRTENKALKLEQANLRSENFEITTGLARTEDKSKNPTEMTTADEEIVGAISKKFESAPSIRYEKGVSNYRNYSDNPKMSEHNERIVAPDIDHQVGNRTLEMKADILRDSRDSGLMNSEKTKADFSGTIEEIQALKLELMNLRDEKATLRSQLEIFKEESNALKSERTALKDELAASRKSNFDLRLKVNDLRGANEKLRETNMGLGDRLQDALREMNEYTAVSEVSDGKLKDNFEDASSDNRKKYIFAERNLRINRRNRFDYVSNRNPDLQSIEKNLQHIEGHKRIQKS